jgi:N-methylhydantoinase A
MYGFVADGDPVQLVTFRVEASGVVRKATFVPEPDCGPDASAAVIARRDVFVPEAGGFVSCAVYDRDKLHAGNRIAGPAVIEQMDATTWLLPGMQARVEPYLNLVLE